MSQLLGFITVDKRGRAVFPLALRRELGLSEGRQLRIERSDDGAYELVPAKLVPRDRLYFHSPEMRERVERAEQSFRDGTSTRTEGEEATRQFLDALKKG